MERLTRRDEFLNADIVTNALNLLAAYKDTMRTPEEIHQLALERDVYRRDLEVAKKLAEEAKAELARYRELEKVFGQKNISKEPFNISWNDHIRLEDALKSIGALFDTTDRNVAIMPAIDAAPVVRGRWEILEEANCVDTYGNPSKYAKCTNCEFRWNDIYSVKKYFTNCPFCGAQMDAEQEE